jgi:hypothetical protein
LYPALFHPKKEGIMARPIEATPILEGKDAERFIAAARNPKPFTPPKVDNAEALKRIKQTLLDRAQKSV